MDYGNRHPMEAQRGDSALCCFFSRLSEKTKKRGESPSFELMCRFA